MVVLSSALSQSINEYFTTLADPRRETKNKIHNFLDILTIAMCGAICGANYWTEIAAYGRAKESWLRTFLELPNGIPSHDTFNDVFKKINAEQFEQCFSSWVASISTLLPGEVISIDGKTIRRSHDSTVSRKPIHMVSAWSTSNALVLGQFKTEEKSNEITAIPMLLELLSIEKSLVTIDAMGCQKKIAECILNKGADYLLALKDNQPRLYDAVKSKFFDENGSEEVFTKYAEQNNEGHGRQEIRRCWVCDSIGWSGSVTDEWKGLNAIVVIESERTIGNKTSLEHRFYITSKKRSASYFLKAIRDHWHIENKLHWSLDVAFREDESRLRKGNGAENFSLLRRIALNLLKKEASEKAGIKGKRLRAGWDNEYLMTVLSGMVL